jgi:peptidoglycan pentaglycine glycine transferase (the first glycine)
MWGRVKDAVGWRAVRFLLEPSGEITGGCQLFLRDVPALGTVAYAPHGPVLDDAGAGAAELLQAIATFGRGRLRYLLFEPSNVPPLLQASLAARGFEPAVLRVGPRATLVLPLDSNEDDLLKRMKGRTRYNVRLAAKKGIEVHRSSEDDLSNFYKLLRATARRQRFQIYPESYYRRLWKVLAPGGQAQLFMATYQGAPVSAQLAIVFGSTVTNKLTAWSGAHADRKPNEAVHWGAIRWAAAAGFKYYDFEGVDASVARALLNGDDVQSDAIPSVTAFKLGFGGEPRLEPQSYERVSGRLARFAYRNVLSRTSAHAAFRSAISTVRTQGRVRDFR